MLKTRRFWIGLAVSALFLILLLYRVDLGEVWEALKGANYLYALPAVALYFIAVFFRTQRWKYLLSPLGSFSTLRLYPVVVVGYMANNLLPVRLGELVRAYYLGEREKVSVSATLATILVERVYDGLTLLFFVAVALPVLALSGAITGLGNVSNVPWVALGIVTAVLFMAAIVILTLLATSPRASAFAERLTLLVPGRFRPRAREIVSLFIAGLSYLNSPQRHLRLFILSLPVWLFEGAMYLLIALGFHLPDYISGVLIIPAILLATATANLAISLPSSQGGIGPFEYLTAATLELVGAAGGVARAYAVALHLIVLAPVTLLGLVYLWWQNLSLAQLARQDRVSPESTDYDKGTVVAGEEKE